MGGTVEAPDRRVALLRIEELGHIPVAVQEGASSAPSGVKASPVKWKGRGRRMSARDVLVFTTELSDLLASGMRMGNALNVLANRKTGRATDQIIASLRDEIIQGTSLSDAMAKHPSTFSKLYVSMIRAGEASGAMADVLSRLVEHYERMQELKEKVVAALVYPAIVLVMGLATMVFSMVYVVPKFTVVFEQMQESLPLPTQILISLSEWLIRYGWAMAISIVVLVILLNRGIQTKAGRLWWDGLLLKLPLLRGVISSSTFASFARTLGTLLSNGVPVLQALGIVENTVGNTIISREIRKARDRVTDGTTISGPLAAGKIFPSLMTEMLAIGEETGDMSSALGHIARRYESDLDRSLKIFTTALEPILLVLVALMVGFVAISILTAVFSMTNGLDV